MILLNEKKTHVCNNRILAFSQIDKATCSAMQISLKKKTRRKSTAVMKTLLSTKDKFKIIIFRSCIKQLFGMWKCHCLWPQITKPDI